MFLLEEHIQSEQGKTIEENQEQSRHQSSQGLASQCKPETVCFPNDLLTQPILTIYRSFPNNHNHKEIISNQFEELPINNNHKEISMTTSYHKEIPIINNHQKNIPIINNTDIPIIYNNYGKIQNINKEIPMRFFNHEEISVINTNELQFKSMKQNNLNVPSQLSPHTPTAEEPINLITANTRVNIERRVKRNDLVSDEVQTNQVSFFIKKTSDNPEQTDNVNLNTGKINKQLRIILKGFQCPKCSFVSTCQAQLKFHKKNTRHKHQEKFQCSICLKSLNQKSNLEYHMKKVHEKNFKWPHCEKHFNRKDNLRVHIIGIHLKIKHYECHLCYVKFPTPTGIKNHFGKHHGLVPWKCGQCSLGFKVKKSLNQHSMKEHSVNIAPDVVCLLCNQFFQSREKLFSHRAEAHQMITWKCKECGKVFGRTRIIMLKQSTWKKSLTALTVKPSFPTTLDYFLIFRNVTMTEI